MGTFSLLPIAGKVVRFSVVLIQVVVLRQPCAGIGNRSIEIMVIRSINIVYVAKYNLNRFQLYSSSVV